MKAFESMDRDELLEALRMFAKNWLAHDGSWFLACEQSLGLEEAIRLDAEAWRTFARAEASRIMRTFGIKEGGGLEALEKVLSLRMYAAINPQHTEWVDEGRVMRFYMDSCRVQETRKRKGLPDFPCKPVGEVEFSTIAATVDPRIEVRCLYCPPDPEARGRCAWEFRLKAEEKE